MRSLGTAGCRPSGRLAHLSTLATATAAVALASVLTASVASASVPPRVLTSTTTSISSVSSDPTVASPITVDVSVAGTGASAPTGTVTVSDGTNTCQASLSSSSGETATGSCTITELSPNTYTFNASYDGDGSNASSTTASGTTVTVVKATPTVKITASGSSAQVGQPVSFTVTVSDGNATAAVAPTGSVTVSNATSSCDATLAGTTENGVGACSISMPTTGKLNFSASYPGDSNFNSAGSSSKAGVTVADDTTTTTLSLSDAKVAYGDEQTTKLSASVKATYGGSVTGSVKFEYKTTVLCTKTVADGAASCSLGATDLAPGTYSVVAAFEATGHFKSSSSSKHTLTIDKASSSTKLDLSTDSVLDGNEDTVTFAATVSPEYAGDPSGTVTVYYGSTALCHATLSGGKASCSPTASALGPGSYKLTAVYGGNSDFSGSTSPDVDFTVTGNPNTG